MNPAEITEALQSTLEDFRVSRSERRALKLLIDQTADTPNELAVLRSNAFELARREIEKGDLTAGSAKDILDWLEEVNKLLVDIPKSNPVQSEAVFSSQQDCAKHIQGLISTSRSSIDVCVFTITDDRVTNKLIEAFKRKVKIRIISDDEKASDPGSDIYRLKQEGVDVRTDRDANHMHHKFAIFDGRRLLNGSYNWTRSAALRNEENYVVTDEAGLLRNFKSHFERLWHLFG